MSTISPVDAVNTALAPTTDRTPGTAPTPSALGVTPGRVLRSEWTKLRSLRSTVWTLLSAFVLMVGVGALFSAVTANQFPASSPQEKAAFLPIGTSLNGVLFAQLAIGVLGVLVMTGEYGTGMIRASMTVVPRRLPVLWAKLTVFAASVLSVSVVASFGAFFAGQALLNRHGLGVSITAPGAVRQVVGAALYLTVAGMIGLALGALLRTTAAGIATFAGVFFVIPPLMQLLPASVGDHVTKYLPSNAGAVLYGGGGGLTNALSPWTGFALLCAYAVLVIGVAAWRLRRVDV